MPKEIFNTDMKIKKVHIIKALLTSEDTANDFG